jgi:hypothetical protein
MASGPPAPAAEIEDGAKAAGLDPGLGERSANCIRGR